MANESSHEQATILGHPVGLYTLFFAEMWERFSYYGMRALLVFYMIKGFMGYGDEQAYTVYGAYTALVYMTPFIGGMLADKVLGQRIAVVIGGTLMAAGHLLMTIESEWPFFFALALLIVGNGFFKPNISTMVGSLYAAGSPKRDDGFNIFYMGINLGAAMSPLLCGYIGETYGWHYGFGLATIGMLTGLAVFVMPTVITQLLIGAAAVASATGLVLFRPDNVWAISINIFIGASLLIAAIISCTALSRGGLPNWAGARPDSSRKGRDILVYAGILISIPVFALLVSGFSPFRTPDEPSETNEQRLAKAVSLLERFDVNDEIIETVKEHGVEGELKARGKPLQIIKPEVIERIEAKGKAWKIPAIFLAEISKPAGMVLTVLGLLAFGYLFLETFRLDKVAKERMLAALVLIFFQMLFFAFFEQAGSSLNNFTDRNVDRVAESEIVTEDMVGQTIRIQPTQAQFGFIRADEVFTLSDLEDLRDTVKPHPQYTNFDISWTVSEDNIGMNVANRLDELPASIFQSVNPTFILIFALVFNFLWASLRRLKLEPSAPVKFAFGLIQLGLGFGAFWMGAQSSNDQGMVALYWLFLGYLLQTTGELCLSPVGLSTMTKLSPKALVSTLMGGWFLATAFSQYLAAIISQFTGVEEGSEGASFPPPIETVNIYGDVFGKVALTAMACGLVCLIISPILKRWMHEDEVVNEP
jgi:POT family proton-dependent oligopeptide transporter